MKRIFAILLITSIAIIAVFGAFAMQHTNERGHMGCLAAAAPAPACPAGDVIAMFLFHAGILKSLLLAVANGYMAFVLLSILFVITFVLTRERAGPFFARQYAALLFFFENFSLFETPFIRWLALHENSPSFV